MGKDIIEKFEELFSSPQHLSISDFERYVSDYLKRKADSKLAIRELDSRMAVLHSHILSLSVYLKQNHLLSKALHTTENGEAKYLTKQEVANKYRVSIRTVTNWIIDGLECIEVGGVKRISEKALLLFIKTTKRKKFSWKSIAR